MKKKTLWMRFGGLICLAVLASAPSNCDSHSQEQQDWQDELNRQNAARRQAEQTARDAEESQRIWIEGLFTGSCTLSLVALLIGVGIGSRAVRRYRKDYHRERE